MRAFGFQPDRLLLTSEEVLLPISIGNHQWTGTGGSLRTWLDVLDVGQGNFRT